MNVYADLFGRNRVLIALIAVVFSSLAGYGITFLEIDDTPRNLFAAQDDDFRQLESLFKDFGSDDNDCVVVLEGETLYAPEGASAIRKILAGVLAERAHDLGLESVQSVADIGLLPPESATPEVYQRQRDEALRHPLVAGQLLSRDGKMMLIFARIRSDYDVIKKVEPAVNEVRRITAEAVQGTSLRGSVTGIPTLRAEVIQSLRATQLNYTILGTGIAFFAGILVFRRPTAVLVVSLPAFVSVFWTLGLLGLMGEKLNVVNSVMPSLILVIAFTDAVHLLVHIRKSRAEGMERLEAVQSAIRHLGLACFMTSFTTAIGFGSLLVARVQTVQGLGIDCAFGAMVGFIATIMLVPLLASTRLGDNLVLKQGSETEPLAVRWMAKLLVASGRWPRTVTVLGTIATIYFCWTALSLKPDNRLTETLPTGSPSYQTMERCDEAFGGVLLVHTVVDWPEGTKLGSPELLAVHEDLHALYSGNELLGSKGQPLLVSPISYLNFLQAIPRGRIKLENLARAVAIYKDLPIVGPLTVPPTVLGRFVREDLRRSLVSIHIRDIGVQEYQPVFDKARIKLAELEKKHPGFKLRLTGTPVVASYKVREMIEDLASSLMLAGLIIFIIMALAFRSALLGFISVLPNIFPLALTAATLVWLGMPLQMASVIVFNIGIGMAVDNTIHLITRFQRELPIDRDVHAALGRTGMSVGKAVLSTTVVLLAGFGSVGISEIPVTRLFSMLACMMLASALIGDLILLPAMLAVFFKQSPPNSQPALLPRPSWDDPGVLDVEGREREAADTSIRPPASLPSAR
ncbi:MMPL family transporter [bacterium]|nr:MMPL family transporter [bacterium]